MDNFLILNSYSEPMDKLPKLSKIGNIYYRQDFYKIHVWYLAIDKKIMVLDIQKFHQILTIMFFKFEKLFKVHFSFFSIVQE